MMQDIDSGRQTYRGAADRQTDIHRGGQMETERHTQSRTDTDRKRDREAYTEQVRYRQTDGHT